MEDDVIILSSEIYFLGKKAIMEKNIQFWESSLK